MIKNLLLVLTTIMILGCDSQNPDGTYSTSLYKTYVIDSCEYIGYANSSQYDFLAHKGNCRFCQERKDKETKALIKLFEKELLDK
jgi:hypothetical protein